MRSPLRGFPQKSRSGDRPGDGDFHSLSARWPIGRLFGQLCRSWLRWFSTGGGSPAGPLVVAFAQFQAALCW